MGKEILFVTEGGGSIGYGHLKRSITIAKKIRKVSNNNIVFLINNNDSVKEILTEENFLFKTLSTVPSLQNQENSIVIFDTKKQINHLIEPFMNQENKLILIDNTTDSRYLVDICIIPAVNPLSDLNWDNYRGKFYVSHELIPVDESYQTPRMNYEKLTLQQPYKLLITMGGSDPNNITTFILNSLKNFDIPIEIKVVVGPGFQTIHELKNLEKEMPNVELIYNRKYLGDLMAISHLAFTAVGTTIYELATVGVPTIIIANYEFDQSDLNIYRDMGFNVPLGIFPNIGINELLSTVHLLLTNRKKWTELKNTSKSLIDGKGLERLVQLILS